jgi:hypothetical protein
MILILRPSLRRTVARLILQKKRFFVRTTGICGIAKQGQYASIVLVNRAPIGQKRSCPKPSMVSRP